MSRASTPLFAALQFLTRFPLPRTNAPDDGVVARSLAYYPVAGLLLGLALAAAALLLKDAPALLRAALLLALWVYLTGALHLDGLADCADAWVGGLGDRPRTLAIMKDPHCGSAALSATVLVLLLKFSALHAVSDMWTLATIPLLARTTALLLFLTTPYVRPRGIASALAVQRSALPNGVSIGLAWAGAFLLVGATAAALLATTLLVFFVLRRAMLQRLGGTTGDSAGALIEIAETAMLAIAASLRTGSPA